MSISGSYLSEIHDNFSWKALADSMTFPDLVSTICPFGDQEMKCLNLTGKWTLVPCPWGSNKQSQWSGKKWWQKSPLCNTCHEPSFSPFPLKRKQKTSPWNSTVRRCLVLGHLSDCARATRSRPTSSKIRFTSGFGRLK